jgi:hypothetical protein
MEEVAGFVGFSVIIFSSWMRRLIIMVYLFTVTMEF